MPPKKPRPRDRSTRADPEEQLLKRLIAATQDAVVFIDDHARIVRFNRAASGMFGYAPDEALGQPVTMLMSKDHASRHDEYIARYERTGEARAVDRIRTVSARRKNGETFSIELSVTEVGSREVRYAAFIRDISESVRIRAKLAEKERLAAVGLITSMFAHEVANPLNAIYIQGQLLQRRVNRLALQDTLGEGVEAILSELRRLNTLLNEFRGLYRGSSSGLMKADVVSLLVDVLRALPIDPVESGIEVHRELHEELAPVLGNADKLKQVFINLCKNAIEAMPDGGRLTVRAHARDGRVVVEIQDTGVGIPAGFDPFETFHTTKHDGSGLGLTIVRQLVTDHGGSVSFTSEPGLRTTFEVRLPIAE